jgi:hypothetical protein
MLIYSTLKLKFMLHLNLLHYLVYTEGILKFICDIRV